MTVERKWERIDILVNNAGLGPPNPAECVVKGTFFVSKAVGRLMLAQGCGRIINLSSQAGFVALPTESVYCMTKAAIRHLTQCLAVEWGPAALTSMAWRPRSFTRPAPRSGLATQISGRTCRSGFRSGASGNRLMSPVLLCSSPPLRRRWETVPRY